MTAQTSRFTNLYRILTLALLASITVIGVLSLTQTKNPQPLPGEARHVRGALSDRPVSIDDVVSCSCWGGPRNQAQRKYRFHVVNNTDSVLNIGGGADSQVRLIVAYPTRNPPPLTFPKPTDGDESARFGTPSDVDLRIASTDEVISPTHLEESNALFSVPSRYSVWALPPVPNRLAEILSTDGDRATGTFPTVVDKSRLLPGEGYSGTRRGHGDWTFYVPLDNELARQVQRVDPSQVVIPDAENERHLIFVGIGVFEGHGSGSADLLGFAPAPSDASLLDPSDF